MRKFFPHQMKGYWEQKDSKNLILFWEMRLGKTLVAIRWMRKKAYGGGRILVVAPLSVLESWERELFLEKEKYVTLTGSREDREKECARHWEKVGTNWYLINYEGLFIPRARTGSKRKVEPTLISRLPWKGVVLDESTRIRNPKAQTTRVVQEWLSSATYKAILSGLPNPESELDYFEQMKFVYGSFLGEDSYWSFRYKYFNQYGYSWEPKVGLRTSISREVRPFTLTRKKVRIGPKKVKEVRYVSLPPEIEKLYKKCEKEFVLGEFDTKYITVMRLWLQRLVGGYYKEKEIASDHKVKELKSLLTGELKNDRVVVFYRFNEEIEASLKALRRSIPSIAAITGATPREDRASLRVAFQKGDKRILLCQTQCVKYGLDFSSSSTVIYYSNWEEYEVRRQSEDRIIHATKIEPCLYIDLCCRDTIDYDILQALKRKGTNSRVFVSDILKSMRERNEYARSNNHD